MVAFLTKTINYRMRMVCGVKVCVETYGCTMNQGEGAMLESMLTSLGHEVVDDPAAADLVVLNTCTVISETENRMLKRMGEISSQRKHLVVSGCMAAIQADAIVKKAPNAMIIAPRDYGSFTELIESSVGRADLIPLFRPAPISATLPISQGCVGACSYCITKAARGTLASYPIEDLVASARKHIDSGSREILVTAQDTACYGFDSGKNLSSVLSSLVEIPGDFMVRVGMMNPDNLARVIDDLIPAWMHPKVYKFIHLPVQSGSDDVLDAMNRGYKADEFAALVSKLREACPNMTLSTDVITGFPGETEEDHRATVKLIEEMRPDTVNVTRYSPRPGTPAAKAKNQIPGWVSKERSRELTKLRFAIAEELHQAMIGRRERILIIEVGKPGSVIGRTSSYRPVAVQQKLPLGSKVEVEITEAAPTYLLGRVL